jgi:ABC-type transport system substrate-binding protein
MRMKRLLIALPLITFGALLQSALWVPTYESQAKGNPARLTTFVRAVIGEPKFLNPVILADHPADVVMIEKVMEALVGADEHAKLVPRLADHWETTEEAYIAVLPNRTLPDGTAVSARSLLAALNVAWKDRHSKSLEHVTAIAIVPGEERSLTQTVLVENAKGKKEPVDVAMTVTVPERIKLQLSKVDPGLFDELEPLLGAGYFKDYPFSDRFRLAKPEQRTLVKERFPELLGVGEHNPIITFTLRPGIRWHDGVPLSAEDVKFTYEAFIDPKNASPRASSYDPIKSVEVLNELTARITYKRLYAPAILDWAWPLVPKHLLDGPALQREMDRRQISKEARKTFTMRNSDFERKPIGTGPYRFAQWLPDQYIRLTRNDDYWGAKSQYKDLYFRAIPDYLTMELEFQAGALDWYDARPHQAERYRKNPAYHVVLNSEGNYTYIAYNQRRPPFDDIRVRRALGMAIDVENVIRYVMYGQARRATGPFYRTTPFNDPTVEPLPYDPQGALALLAEAGWHKNAAGMLEKNGKPLQFTLVTNNGNPQRKAVMIVAQEAWRNIGIDCKIQAFEWSVFIEDFVSKDNFDAMVLGWIGADLNPDKFQLWHSSQTHPFELNYGGYQSREADALIERIRVEYDTDEQVRLTHQLHRRIAEDQPYTFLYEEFRPVVLDKRIARVVPGPGGRETIAKIEAIPSSSIDQLIAQWRKLSTVPEFSAQ